MAEQKILVTIDENGKISASTQGFKGEVCLDELEKLLGDLADLNSVTKTDEFYQKSEVKAINKIENKQK